MSGERCPLPDDSPDVFERADAELYRIKRADGPSTPESGPPGLDPACQPRMRPDPLSTVPLTRGRHSIRAPTNRRSGPCDDPGSVHPSQVRARTGRVEQFRERRRADPQRCC